MMSKYYIVIDVGCHECGEGSEVLKTFTDEKEAEKFRNEHSKKTGNWGQIGQVIPEVFEVEI